MRRRAFIAGLTGGVAAWPPVARAQQSAKPVVGYLDGASAAGRAPFVAAFRDGLKQAGFVEGENISIEYRWANNRIEQLPELAADLVRRDVKVICVGGNIAAQRVQSATATIPVVFVVGNDPVKLGLVKGLNHPGGNLTGITPLNADLGPKRLQVLHEMMPSATTVALLVNPANPLAEALPRDLEQPASGLGVRLDVNRAGSDAELDAAFAAIARRNVRAVMIGADTFFNGRVEQLAALALRYKLPTIYQTREFAAAGGLVSYGASITEAFRIAGSYTSRILKGERPADLPVQQASRIEMVINVKTAKMLDVSVPSALLASADEVIE